MKQKQSEQARFERIIESRPALLARSQEEPTYLNELTWKASRSSRIIGDRHFQFLIGVPPLGGRGEQRLSTA
jgi:hypothetical protein